MSGVASAIANIGNSYYYDGYYDDVMPPDLDREKDGMDKALVKRIIVLAMCVTIIIFMCVAFLYVL